MGGGAVGSGAVGGGAVGGGDVGGVAGEVAAGSDGFDEGAPVALEVPTASPLLGRASPLEHAASRDNSKTHSGSTDGNQPTCTPSFTVTLRASIEASLIERLPAVRRTARRPTAALHCAARQLTAEIHLRRAPTPPPRSIAPHADPPPRSIAPHADPPPRSVAPRADPTAAVRRTARQRHCRGPSHRTPTSLPRPSRPASCAPGCPGWREHHGTATSESLMRVNDMPARTLPSTSHGDRPEGTPFWIPSTGRSPYSL